MAVYDARIDAYIEKSAPFAKPILQHLRKMVHLACPNVEETIKWGMPHFDYMNGIMCSMGAFKQHCVFGFSKASLMKDHDGILTIAEKHSMGHLGKITSLKDLPQKSVFTAYIKQAMQLNEQGIKLPRPSKKVEEIDLPEDLLKSLNKNKTAFQVFRAFSPGKRKDYVLWLEDAKTDITREKRLRQAMEWIAEGKSRNWKYEKK